MSKTRTVEQQRRYSANWRNKDIGRARRLNRESAARRRLNPEYRAAQKEYMSAYCRTPEYRARRAARKLANWQHHLYLAVRSGAKRRGIAFSILEHEVPWTNTCPVLGVPIGPRARGRPTDDSASIDRADNSLGYVPGNVFVVSYRANRIKNDATVAELERIVAFYREKLCLGRSTKET